MRLPTLFRASLHTGSRARPKQANVLATAAALAAQHRDLAHIYLKRSASVFRPVTTLFRKVPASQTFSGFRLRTRDQLAQTQSSITSKFIFGLISLNTFAGGKARKLIYQRMPIDLDALPSYHSRGQRMQGGISNEEFYRRIRQGESVPRAAVTERRLSTGLKKIHSFTPGPGEHVSIFQVRTSRGTYLRVDGCSLDILMKEANGNAEGEERRGSKVSMCIWLED